MTPLMPVDKIAQCCQSTVDDVHHAMAILGKRRYGQCYMLDESDYRPLVNEVDTIKRMNERAKARREALSSR